MAPGRLTSGEWRGAGAQAGALLGFAVSRAGQPAGAHLRAVFAGACLPRRCPDSLRGPLGSVYRKRGARRARGTEGGRRP